jgi:heat shock protein HslJ
MSEIWTIWFVRAVTVLVSCVLLVFIGGCKPEGENGALNPENATYTIESEAVALQDGSFSKQAAPGSATMTSVSIYGNPVYGDIDGDEDDDAVLILVRDPGGSGTFYYSAIAVNTGDGYIGTDAILLGDRITPQSVRIEDGRAKVDFMTRNVDESFAVEPTHKRSIHLRYNPETFRLIQVAVDFEGEADPDVMTLSMKPWRWIKTIYNNDTEVTPMDTASFVVTFLENDQFSASTDCNTIRGTSTVNGHRIAFGSIVASKKYCDTSQEDAFTLMLKSVQSYMFTGRGELILELKYDSGSMVFR